jgi:uncharacterized protein YndB with AHSA1/START domain
MSDLTARACVTVAAPPKKVWDALTTPETIKRYMFGTTVTSDWKVRGPITWKGEWEGKKYEDKGVIKQFKPQQVIQYSHFSPLAGLPDKPENYHTVTIELSGDSNGTHVSLSQDNNKTEEERAHSTKNWEMMLASLKKVVEE